jgi:hypothetical protein
MYFSRISTLSLYLFLSVYWISLIIVWYWMELHLQQLNQWYNSYWNWIDESIASVVSGSISNISLLFFNIFPFCRFLSLFRSLSLWLPKLCRKQQSSRFYSISVSYITNDLVIIYFIACIMLRHENPLFIPSISFCSVVSLNYLSCPSPTPIPLTCICEPRMSWNKNPSLFCIYSLFVSQRNHQPLFRHHRQLRRQLRRQLLLQLRRQL